MEVLVTGGDTALGRAVAESFRAAGHQLTLAGVNRRDLKEAAAQLEAKAVVCDSIDPAGLDAARRLFPHHLDAIVNVPAPRSPAGNPRAYSLPELAAAWRNAFDSTVLSAVLTVQTVGDHLRSGGTIVSVVPANTDDGGADAAAKAALANWTAGQAAVFGTRGITVNVVAAGRGSDAGYDGLTGAPPTVTDEIARLALFLATSAARHITGQTLHVSDGALAHFG